MKLICKFSTNIIICFIIGASICAGDFLNGVPAWLEDELICNRGFLGEFVDKYFDWL